MDLLPLLICIVAFGLFAFELARQFCMPPLWSNDWKRVVFPRLAVVRARDVGDRLTNLPNAPPEFAVSLSKFAMRVNDIDQNACHGITQIHQAGLVPRV